MQNMFKKIHIPAIVKTLIVFILGALVSGELNNVGIFLFSSLGKALEWFFSLDSWFWITFLFLLGGVLIYIWYRWKLTKNDLEIKKNILEMDNWMQRLTPNLVSAQDIDAEMENLISQLLQRAASVFNEPLRSAIFLPDESRKRLTIVYSDQLSNAAIRRTIFDIEPGKMNTLQRDERPGKVSSEPTSFPSVTSLQIRKRIWNMARYSPARNECLRGWKWPEMSAISREQALRLCGLIGNAACSSHAVALAGVSSQLAC